MPRIAAVTARQILDSRGVPTVEATVELDNGLTATSSAPSGTVANKVEAEELRDHNTQEYFGMGVSKAVANVNTVINERLVGQDPLYQTQIDQMLVDLDGTTNKSKLGANAILATSQAVIKVAAASLKLPLFMYVKEKYQLIQAYRIPTPIFNLMNGGRHGSGTLDFQEFQLVPASHLPYNRALRIGVEMFMALEKILEQKGAIRTVGVEGGYSPNLATNTDALEIFSEAMKLTSYSLAQDAFLGLDVAPKWFFKGGKYTVKDRPQPLQGKQLVKFYQDLHHQYRVFAFEDPLVADAWADWKFMTAEMGQTAMIVADDLITTNKTLLMKAIQEQACNAIVIKPNRVGTITEAIEIVSLAKQAGWHTIMSHRSGEVVDDILADIAVGIGTDYVKFGAPSRGERVAKYNRLLQIEEILLRSKEQMQSGDQNMADNTTNAAPTMAPSVAPAATASPTPAPAADLPAWSRLGPSEGPNAYAPTGTAQPSAATTPAAVPTPTPAPTPVATPVTMPEPTPVAPQVQPIGEVSVTAPAVNDAPTASPSMPPLSTTPSATPGAPLTPTMPTLGATPTLTATPPETTASVAPAAPSNEPEISQLQNDLNQLAQMVTPGASAPAAPMSSAPEAPLSVAPAQPTPAPAPTPVTPPEPATVTPPAVGPAGLTPPTPPSLN